jgi:dihydrolipoamide dehydrogenase
VGCIPSKALIELSDSAVRAASSPGLLCGAVQVDLAAFQAHKRAIVAGLAGGVAGLMRRNHVKVMSGELRFTGPGAAVVVGAGGATHLRFEDAIVAVGSRPAELREIMPFDGERVLDSGGLLALEALPESLCIVGAGYIGLELGIAFAKLGVSVTIVEALDRLLGGIDRDLSRIVAKTLERLGVETLLGASVTGVDDTHVVVRTAEGQERRLAAERVGVAVGRNANTDGLGLDLLGASLDDHGLVRVDADRRAERHLAAIGDITAGPALAHKASAEAAVAAAALSGQVAAFTPQAVPIVMFTDPEVATTGLTVSEAEAEGLDALAGTFPMSALGRAATLHRTEGFVRLVADRANGVVIGAQVVGVHASELIAEATLAIEMGATLEDLALTIHAHPTLAEGFGEAAELALGQLA